MTTDLEQLREQMRDIIYASPQAGVLEEQHVENWINRVLDIEPDRALWHCIRLHGSGGSEVGPLSKSLRGEANNFTSAHQIVAGKLCIIPPGRGDEHTRRGQVLEDLVRTVFEDQMAGRGYKLKRLTDEREQLIENAENDKYFWMRSSLDEFYEVTFPDGETVERWVVDFKCPSQDMMSKYVSNTKKIMEATETETDLDYVMPNEDTRKAFGWDEAPEFDDYIYQLHHYREDADIKGVQVDRTVLATFDYMRASVTMFDIEYDPKVVADIVEASEYYWNDYVLKGKVPPSEKKPAIDPEEVPEEIQEAASDFLRFKTAEKEFGKLAAAKREVLEDYAAKAGSLGENKLKLAGADITAKLLPDEELAETRLAELGLGDAEIDALRKAGDYDTKKVKTLWHGLVTAFSILEEGVSEGSKPKVQDAMSSIKELGEKLPQKKKGALDAKKLREALLSFGEDPNCFFKEELSTAVARGKSTERDLIQDDVLGKIEELEDTLKRAEPVMGPSI